MSPRAGRLVPFASLASYRPHLEPIVALLPQPAPAPAGGPGPGPRDVAVVAAYRDLVEARRAGFRRFARLEHGAGQSYGGDPESATNPAYAGGDDHEDVELFLVPGPDPAARWSARYPRARVAIVGSPAAEATPARVPGPGPGPVVAVAFHWNCPASQEAGSAISRFWREVGSLGRSRFEILGHGHPRRVDLTKRYAATGLEFVPEFADVARRADVLVADNSSTLFEFAASGRPVVLLNAPAYRRSINHGLRFWDAAGVGIQVDEARDLEAAIVDALADGPALRDRRAAALELVYARPAGGAARAAADALLELVA